MGMGIGDWEAFLAVSTPGVAISRSAGRPLCLGITPIQVSTDREG